jgi:hypothetical protein
VLDGVNRRGGDGVPTFIEVAAPTGEDLHTLLQTAGEAAHAPEGAGGAHGPALPAERVQRNSAGLVELRPKTARREGTTHMVMTPLQCMQWRAAMVPRVHLSRFHGVLAPHTKLWPVVVPRRRAREAGYNFATCAGTASREVSARRHQNPGQA